MSKLLNCHCDGVGDKRTSWELLSMEQVMDFSPENHLSSRAVGVHCVSYREYIVLTTSVLFSGKKNFRLTDDETSGILLRHLVVTLWRKIHEVLFTQAMTDGTKIVSVWVSQKSKKTAWNEL